MKRISSDPGSLLKAALLSMFAMTMMAASVAHAEHHKGEAEASSDFKGRIMLVNKLDEPDGLCLDIPGPPDDMALHVGAWIHTCHPYPILDQVFHFDSTGKIISAVPGTDLCVSADSAEVGSKLYYKPCSESPDLNRFGYLENAQLQLLSTKNSEMPLCVAAAVTGPPPFTEPSEGQDPRGESIAINPSASHLARFVQMQPCAEVKLELSRWEAFEERPPEQFRRLK